MVRPSSLIALFLLGCAQATAVPHAAPASEPTPTQEPGLLHQDGNLQGDDWRALTWDGAQGTRRTLRVLQERFDALPPAKQAELVASARSVTVTCPYNRSLVQIVLAMNEVVQRHDARDMNLAIRPEWQRLQSGLAEHIALYESLGVAELPLPSEVELLAFSPYVQPAGEHSPLERRDGLLFTAEQVRASDDPIGDMAPLIASIQPIVDTYPEPTKLSIETWRATLTDALQEYWPMKMQLIGWRHTLERIRVHAADDPELERDLTLLIDTINELTALYC